MNKYTATKVTYFSQEESYNATVTIEEDGTLDQWIEICCANGVTVLLEGRSPMGELVELRDLLSYVISDLKGENF